MKRLLFVALAVLMLTNLSFAQAEIGLNAVGGHIGYIMPEDPIDNTIGFGAAADLGTIRPDIHLKAFLDYWGKTYDAGYYEWTYSEIIVGATAKYYFAKQGEFLPYAGGGLGLVIGKSSGKYTGPQYSGYTYADDSSSDTKLGFHFCAGADYPLSPTLTGFGEIKYTINGADFFGIYIGAVYKLK
ncbi:outer membrane beta-barrel protein [candidate division KSB1 bacterium]|nr:outer membrane beta-barrel protein [candidate division KSB1 bacterium]